MKYTNSILLFVKIATVIYFVIVLVNLILPVLSDSVLNFNLFTVVMLIIWTVAELSSRGYIKKVVSTVDDKIVYDTVLPVVFPTIVRLAEFGWFFLRHRSEFRIGVFCADVALDIVFVGILLLDKSHYYYEAVESEDSQNDDNQ